MTIASWIKIFFKPKVNIIGGLPARYLLFQDVKNTGSGFRGIFRLDIFKRFDYS
jgi:hypothetical protein